MIYTLTMNTAIDMNIICKHIKPAVVNRTQSTRYFPNGKGVNVSLVLRHYGVESKVLGFFGGFTGKFIVDELTNGGLEVKPIWVEEPTRINVFINDGTNEFKFVNRGSFIPEEKQRELLDLIAGLEDCNYLVISGSLSPGIEESYYEQILELCRARGIEVILDISAKKLKDLLKYGPLLIKPNDEEIREIFGISINTEEDVKSTVDKLHNMGARNILLTMGEKGLYFYNGEKLYHCNAPKVKLISSACAGDSSIAAFLSEWLFGKDLEFALKKASATGANVAESEGLGLLDKVELYLKELKVREVL